MKTITIKQYGDTVYYLTDSGFKKGKIKKTLVVSDPQKNLSIKYFVDETLNGPFMGHERTPDKIWISFDDMLKYFEAHFPQ